MKPSRNLKQLMMKSTLGTLLGLVTWSLATACLGADAWRPDLLFIISDDHAEHAISAYGSKVNQTGLPRLCAGRG
ncbi:MAG: hypothetical protein AB9869_22845 [Verrucomicrobiia bacterium]